VGIGWFVPVSQSHFLQKHVQSCKSLSREYISNNVSANITFFENCHSLSLKSRTIKLCKCAHVLEVVYYFATYMLQVRDPRAIRSVWDPAVLKL